MTECELIHQGWGLCMNDVYGRPLRIGPWSKRQAENLAYHQRLWNSTIGFKDRVSVQPHDPSYTGAA